MAITEGKAAPDFTLNDQNGKGVALGTVLAQGF